MQIVSNDALPRTKCPIDAPRFQWLAVVPNHSGRCQPANWWSEQKQIHCIFFSFSLSNKPLHHGYFQQIVMSMMHVWTAHAELQNFLGKTLTHQEKLCRQDSLGETLQVNAAGEKLMGCVLNLGLIVDAGR